jgi:hypothetical protein
LLGEPPSRSELRRRQRRTAPLGMGLCACKRSPRIGLSLLGDNTNRRYDVGGYRSLARHAGPFPLRREAHQSAARPRRQQPEQAMGPETIPPVNTSLTACRGQNLSGLRHTSDGGARPRRHVPRGYRKDAIRRRISRQKTARLLSGGPADLAALVRHPPGPDVAMDRCRTGRGATAHGGPVLLIRGPAIPSSQAAPVIDRLERTESTGRQRRELRLPERSSAPLRGWHALGPVGLHRTAPAVKSSDVA